MFESLRATGGFRGLLRDDAEARAVYSEAAGVARILPRAVAVPVDIDDLAALVRWASAHAVPLIPRGSGSSMAGGAVGDGLIVDLARFTLLGAPDLRSRRVVAGAAVIRDQLQQAVLRHALSFPIDPSSSAFATLGGMVATHAAGARSVHYGPLREWVVGAECVFADGTRAWLRRGEAAAAREVPALARFLDEVAPQVRATAPSLLRREGVRKESSGYALAEFARTGDLLDLIIGSEGTLAFITTLELRLTPLPAATASLLAGFATLEAAASAAVTLAAEGASAVELLDRSFLEIAASDARTLALPDGLEAVLIVELEMHDELAVRRRAAALAELAQQGGAAHVETAMSPDHEVRLWQLRHAASPILNQLAPTWQNLQLIEDGCVPPGRFAEYVLAVRQALRRARFRGVIFGHAGDAHAHVNALVNTGEPDWRARCEQLVEEVTATVARLGGTLAGEHGDGRLRTPLMARTWSPEAMALFAATKHAFDPQAILNPGVKVPLAGARPLEAIKYDPDLPPLPPAARAALDRIVREKAWARSRLDALSAH